QELRAGLLAHAELPMAFQRGEEIGQEWHEPLGADLVGGGPRHLQRRLHLRAIAPHPWSPNGSTADQIRSTQQANSVLARRAGDGDELVEDRRLLVAGRLAIAPSH